MDGDSRNSTVLRFGDDISHVYGLWRGDEAEDGEGSGPIVPTGFGVRTMLVTI